MNNPRQFPTESLSSDLQETLTLLRKKIWLIILCVFGAAIAGVAYIVFAPKTYRAAAIIEVEHGGQKLFKEDDNQIQNLNNEEKIKTIEQALTSPELLLGLITHSNLDKDPEFLPNLKRPASHGKMAEELAKHISAQMRRGTLLIDIKIEDRSSRLALKIADLLITEFVRQNFQQHLEVSETMRGFLLTQAEQLQAKLAKSEEAFQAYKEQHPNMVLGAKDNIVLERLGALNRMVTEAKATRLKLEADYEQLQQAQHTADLASNQRADLKTQRKQAQDQQATTAENNESSANQSRSGRSLPLDASKNSEPWPWNQKLGTGQVTALLAIPSIANSPVVIEAQKNITQHEAEVAAMHQIYRPGDGRTPSAIRELQQFKTALDRMILKAADELTSAYNSAVATEQKMQKALQEQESAALDLNKVSISYNVLRQEVDSDRALYDSVLTRLKETDVTKQDSQDEIRVISHPLLPERPVSPYKAQVLVLSLLGGLALGGGSSILSILLNSSLKTAEEAEGQLGLPALGIIPTCGRRPKWLSDDLLLLEQPGSLAAESFRSLRTSLSLLNKSGKQKTYLFTSAVAYEGKSFCAINCAIAFAQMGLKTLLIDADLRKPSIGKIFWDGTPLDGLCEVLMGRTDLDDTILPTGIDKLFVLGAGIHCDTPAELLASEAFGKIIKQVREKYDRVVIDSAPVHVVSDTLLVAGHVDAICLVVSCGASAHVVSQVIRKLENVGLTPAGIILNRASVRRNGDYQYMYSQGIKTHKKLRKRERCRRLPLPLGRPELTER